MVGIRIDGKIIKNRDYGYIWTPARYTDIDRTTMELQHKRGEPWYFWVIMDYKKQKKRQLTPAEKDSLIIAQYRPTERTRQQGQPLYESIYFGGLLVF